jgi:periplasmic protein TonB
MQALKSLWRCVMSSEKQVKAEPCAGTFSGCLVEGDAETTARERRIKRRAVGVSITLQTAGLAALLIAPLFAKPAALVERVATPIPPYNHHAARHESVPPTPQQTAQVCVICPTLPTRPAMPAQIQGVAPEAPEISRTGEAGAGLIELVGPPPGPDLVLEKSKREQKRIVVGHLDPALLIHRVEPVYPAIPKQLHRSGKVELRAVIATDGSVQSLQVVSGDPLFINSAREAVLQWRYKPTYLNGEPVEIDTYITVIYTLQ